MQHSRLDFLRFAEVPEIFSQITAGAARNVHLGVVLVMTDGALPLIVVVDYDFSVVAAYVAVVRLCVEFGVKYVVVNELDYVFKRFEIVAHIGNFDIAYHTAGGYRLKLTFKSEFGESVYFFPHVHMVGIGVIAFVGDVLYFAEARSVNPRKAIAQRLRGRAVQRPKPISECSPGLWATNCATTES